MRILLVLFLLLAGCPDQSGVSCPPNTSIIGEYALAYSGAHDASDECIANIPYASSPTKLALDDAGVRGATFCLGTGPDGGAQVQLLVPNKGGARVSDLLPDGGFHFANDAGVTPNTACGCDVNIFETLDGNLLTPGPFTLRPDGGLPEITGISARLVDHLVDAGSDAPCYCSFPCTATYSISGTLF